MIFLVFNVHCLEWITIEATEKVRKCKIANFPPPPLPHPNRKKEAKRVKRGRKLKKIEKKDK